MVGAFKKTEKGFQVNLRLIPNARVDQIVGLEKDASGKPYLKVKVRAVPEKGKANKALESFLAKSLGLPKSSIEVISGHTSRAKTVLINGEATEIEAKWRVLLGEG